MSGIINPTSSLRLDQILSPIANVNFVIPVGQSVTFTGGAVNLAQSSLTISDTAPNQDLVIVNTTVSTSGALQNSPLVKIGGTYFSSASGSLLSAGFSASDYWTMQDVVGPAPLLSGTTAITNISESAGNVVTVTLAAQSTFNIPGINVTLSGFPSGKGDWLNGYVVQLLTAVSTSITFNDPTFHGALGNTGLTGTPVITQVSGLSQLTFKNTGSGGGITLTNPTPATATTVGIAPTITSIGTYWNGAASAQETLTETITTATGTNGLVTVTWTASGSNAGTAFIFNDLSNANTANQQAELAIASSSVGTKRISLEYDNNHGPQLIGYGNITLKAGGTGTGSITFQSNSTFTNTSGTPVANNFSGAQNGDGFSPSTGNANYVHLQVAPVINQSGSANGNYTALKINATETSFKGTTARLLDCQLGGISVCNVDHVGNVTASGNITCTGNMTASGYIAGTSIGVSSGGSIVPGTITTVKGIVTAISASSDIRLKETLPYDGGLNAVLEIHPIRYHWNEKGYAHVGFPMHQEFIGFSAQDVQKVIPQAITGTEGSEKYLSLDDRPIIAALVNAVKELSARVDRIETWFNGAQIIKC